MSSTDDAHAARVAAWAGELRAGSTRTWADFRAAGVPGVPAAGVLPGAAALELARRLGGRDVPDRAGLVDLLLATPATGRGPVDVPLPWDGPARPFGTPPAEPDALPAEELLRVLTGAITGLLARTPTADVAPRTPRWKPWRATLAVVGAQTTAARLRDAARARGLNADKPRATHVVVAHPFEELMAQRWSTRVLAGSAMRWPRMWRMAQAHDRVPPGARIPALADRLADRVGAKRVHVVLAADPASAAAQVADLLGVDGLDLGDRPGTGPLATDLLRRLNPLLVLALGEDGRRRVVDQLWPRVTVGEPAAPRLGAPAGTVDWAVRAATRMADRLSGARYAVHGDPALLVPARTDGGSDGPRRRVAPEDVLDFALGVLVQAWTIDRAGER